MAEQKLLLPRSSVVQIHRWDAKKGNKRNGQTKFGVGWGGMVGFLSILLWGEVDAVV